MHGGKSRAETEQKEEGEEHCTGQKNRMHAVERTLKGQLRSRRSQYVKPNVRDPAPHLRVAWFELCVQAPASTAAVLASEQLSTWQPLNTAVTNIDGTHPPGDHIRTLSQDEVQVQG